MAHTITPVGRYSLDLRVRKFATCWKILRTDAVEFKFTDHNEPLIVNGLQYTPISGVSASAKQQKSDIKENNFDVQDVIGSISEDDLRVGKFRNAEVTEMLVDWGCPFYGPIITNKYWIEQTIHNGETWEAQVSGLPAKLKREIGNVYSRNCAWTLGDTRCQFVIVPETGRAVQTVVDDRNEFTGNMAVSTTGHWDYGILTWTSGPNINVSSEIEKNTGQQVKLRFYMPYAIAVGHLFTIKLGCNKLIQTCLDKFNNIKNFGGFPTIPGNDKLIAGAERSATIGKKF